MEAYISLYTSKNQQCCGCYYYCYCCCCCLRRWCSCSFRMVVCLVNISLVCIFIFPVWDSVPSSLFHWCLSLFKGFSSYLVLYCSRPLLFDGLFVVARCSCTSFHADALNATNIVQARVPSQLLLIIIFTLTLLTARMTVTITDYD